MRPSALLRGAAIYLGTHGWTQRQFYDLLAQTDGPFPPACTSGAIMTAATGRCIGSIIDEEDIELEVIRRTLRVFADWVDEGYVRNDGIPVSAIDVIGDWNDDKGRTLAEVIETLMDAANDWEKAHPTGGAQ
jgi:hypothetical protein